MKTRNVAVAALIVLLIVFVTAACQAPTVVAPVAPEDDPSIDQVQARSFNALCYRAQGGSQFVCESGGEIELQSGASLDVQTGATVALTGGFTAGNVALTAPTAAATATPALVVDNLGAGNVAFEVRDSATPVFSVLNGGYVLSRGNYLPKTTSYVITTADSGSVIRTTNAITLTLPGAAAGLQYCIVNGDGNDLVLDPPDGTDYVLVLSNFGGDRVTNTTTGDFLCLFGIDATNWVALGRQGTWSDGN